MLNRIIEVLRLACQYPMRANHTANPRLVIRVATNHTIATAHYCEIIHRYPKVSPHPLLQPLQPAVTAVSILHISDSQLHWESWSRRNWPQSLTHFVLWPRCRGMNIFRPPTFLHRQRDCGRQAGDYSHHQRDFHFQTMMIYPQRMIHSVSRQILLLFSTVVYYKVAFKLHKYLIYLS